MCPSHWLVGFTRVHRDLVVSDGKSGIYPDTVRRTLTRTVSSSRELPRLSRVLRLRTAPHASERDHLPWGCSGPSSRHQLAAISWWYPSHHYPSATFRTSTTGFNSAGRVGLFRPTATSRVPPYRGYASRKAGIDSSSTRALSALAPFRCRRRYRTLARPAHLVGAASRRVALRALLLAGIRNRRTGD